MYKYKIYFIILLTLISVLITFQDENVLSEEPDCPEVHPGYLVAYHDDERYVQGDIWAQFFYWQHMVMVYYDGYIIEADYNTGVGSTKTFEDSFYHWFIETWNEDNTLNNYAILQVNGDYDLSEIFDFCTARNGLWYDTASLLYKPRKDVYVSDWPIPPEPPCECSTFPKDNWHERFRFTIYLNHIYRGLCDPYGYYCTELIWAAFKEIAHIDIDGYGDYGPVVDGDIYFDNDVTVLSIFNQEAYEEWWLYSCIERFFQNRQDPEEIPEFLNSSIHILKVYIGDEPEGRQDGGDYTLHLFGYEPVNDASLSYDEVVNTLENSDFFINDPLDLYMAMSSYNPGDPCGLSGVHASFSSTDSESSSEEEYDPEDTCMLPPDYEFSNYESQIDLGNLTGNTTVVITALAHCVDGGFAFLLPKMNQ